MSNMVVAGLSKILRSFNTAVRGPLVLVVALVVVLINTATVSANTGGEVTHNSALIFLWVAVMLLIGKLSSFVERYGLPAVLGEILSGALLGNLVLVGLHFFEPVKTDSIIAFLAELGVVILLFQIGLESNIQSMRKIGTNALLVALTGVIVTFLLGYFLIPLLAPGLSQVAYLFMAGMFTSTSVGISARVFRDLGKLKTATAQLVLGSAVIDDIIGLIILAVLSAMVTSGDVDVLGVAVIFIKAVAFLVGAILIGQFLAPRIGRLLSKVHSGTGMKLTLALSFGLIFAYLAKQIELAPIIGAFAAGLVLDAVHFRDFKDPAIVDEIRTVADTMPDAQKEKLQSVVSHHADHNIDEIVEPLAIVLVPLFFILNGMNVDLRLLVNGPILLGALGFTAIAIVGKLAAGLAAKSKSKWVVGWGMVPRGEVQLIFASMGKGLGVISSSVFSMVVIVVILTTILTPIILSMLVRNGALDHEK